QLAFAKLDRLAQRVRQTVGRVLRLLLAHDIFEQDRELVAAKSGDRVAAAYAAEQAVRGFSQHQVAGLVAETVIDDFEVVKVEEQHGHLAALTLRACERVRESILEE